MNEHELQAKNAEERKKEEKAAKAAQKAFQLELANRPKGTLGTRGDGQFHIAFIDVGLGDSTILCTPDGLTMMIDCGSTGKNKDDNRRDVETDMQFKKRIKDTVYGPTFLGGTNKKLDILVLTHSDKDHWNLLKPILAAETDIGKCYHSGDLGVGYSVKTVLADHNCTLINAVTLDEEGYAQINEKNPPMTDEKGKIDVICGERSMIKIVDEEHCTIYILASNVYPDGAEATTYMGDKLTLTSTEPNRGSIVLLIEVFGKKLLLCGDATIATEEHMITLYSPWLLDIDVLRVGHHGSETSSELGFIKLVNPQKCVISAGRNIVRHGLPKREIVDRYLSVLTPALAGAPTHSLCGWGDVGDHQIHIFPTGQELYITGMNGTQEITYANTTTTTTSSSSNNSSNIISNTTTTITGGPTSMDTTVDPITHPPTTTTTTNIGNTGNIGNTTNTNTNTSADTTGVSGMDTSKD
jgi:beta-lactamase superfamily II metal-dependent hydrolase